MDSSETTKATEDPDWCLCNKERPDLKYKHKFEWIWDIAGQWTDQARCINCGEVRTMKRDEHLDGYTGKWRGEPIR